MDQLFFIGVAVTVGIVQSVQIGMLAGISRRTGPFESTLISMLASVAGLTALLSVVVLAQRKLELPSPFQTVWPYAAVAIVMTSLLIVAGRELPQWLIVTGLLSIPYLLAASWVGPKIGLAAMFASVVAGQLIGSVATDHFGWFGADKHPVDVSRIAGLGALMIGIYLIRGRS